MTGQERVAFRPMEPEDRSAVLALSRAWAEENITYGYAPDGEKELEDYRCWVAEVGGRVVAYAAGQVETAARDSSIQRAGEQWFELEELYVDRAFRNCGLGGPSAGPCGGRTAERRHQAVDVKRGQPGSGSAAAVLSAPGDDAVFLPGLFGPVTEGKWKLFVKSVEKIW